MTNGFSTPRGRIGLFGLSRFFVSYPIGKITDLYGRKPGIFVGLTLALVGAVLVGLAMNMASFPLLVFALMCVKPTRARPSVTSTSGLGPSASRRKSFMISRSSNTTDVFDISTLSERTRSTCSVGATRYIREGEALMAASA